MTPREAAARAEYWEKVWEWFAIVLGSLLLWLGTSDVLGKGPDTAWTKFVQVEGQPEPVPEQWVSTPEGRFAHSIRIPNPVPKDSGYRRGMSSEEYFQHLCRTEAGEFIFKTVENVEGFYFMRPPKAPTDDMLMSRTALEDPYTERYFQLSVADPKRRATKFINPPWYRYLYVEEPAHTGYWNSAEIKTTFVELSGHVQERAQMELRQTDRLRSRYGFTWRGLKRTADRENAIAGSEAMAYDLQDHRVLGVLRNFVRTGSTRNAKDGIWWLNAVSCPNVPKPYQDNLGQQLYGFLSKILRPTLHSN